jgi:hypothetical protein
VCGGSPTGPSDPSSISGCLHRTRGFTASKHYALRPYRVSSPYAGVHLQILRRWPATRSVFPVRGGSPAAPEAPKPVYKCLPLTRGVHLSGSEIRICRIRVFPVRWGSPFDDAAHREVDACLPRTRGFTGDRLHARSGRWVSSPYAGVHRKATILGSWRCSP